MIWLIAQAAETVPATGSESWHAALLALLPLAWAIFAEWKKGREAERAEKASEEAEVAKGAAIKAEAIAQALIEGIEAAAHKPTKDAVKKTAMAHHVQIDLSDVVERVTTRFKKDKIEEVEGE